VEDGRWAELGVLVDQILPGARRIEDPSRWGLMLMARAGARPYVPDSPARAEYAEALSVTSDAGSPLAVGYVRAHYGNYLCIDGDVALARSLHEESLRTADAHGDDNQSAEAHYFLAMDCLTAGDPDPAYPHLEIAARYYADIDHRDGLTRCLGMLSVLALDRGDPRLAARLTGANAAARDDIGIVPWPAIAEAERRVTERIQAQLPAAEYSAETASGRSTTVQAAVAHALSSLETSTPVTP
jgi:hypothetical protein